MKPNYEIEIDAKGAADQWGPENDPCRHDFLSGYYDFVEGYACPQPPEAMDRAAAYNSGWIAARETTGAA